MSEPTQQSSLRQKLQKAWEVWGHIDTAGGVPDWIRWARQLLPVSWAGKVATFVAPVVVFLVAVIKNFSLPASIVFAGALFALMCVGWWFVNDLRKNGDNEAQLAPTSSNIRSPQLEGKAQEGRTILETADRPHTGQDYVEAERQQMELLRRRADSTQEWLASLTPRFEVLRVLTQVMTVGQWSHVIATTLAITNRGADANSVVAELHYGGKFVVPYGVWPDERCQVVTIKNGHTKDLIVGGVLQSFGGPPRDRSLYVFEDRRRCDQTYTVAESNSRISPLRLGPDDIDLTVVIKSGTYIRELHYTLSVTNDGQVVMCTPR